MRLLNEFANAGIALGVTLFLFVLTTVGHPNLVLPFCVGVFVFSMERLRDAVIDLGAGRH